VFEVTQPIKNTEANFQVVCSFTIEEVSLRADSDSARGGIDDFAYDTDLGSVAGSLKVVLLMVSGRFPCTFFAYMSMYPFALIICQGGGVGG
jgi:hypothetical protein